MNVAGANFLAGIGNSKFGISEDVRSSAGDAAALFMLGLIVLIIILVIIFAVTMARRARKPDHTLEFLEGLDEGDGVASPPKSPGPDPSWQKPADWWNR